MLFLLSAFWILLLNPCSEAKPSLVFLSIGVNYHAVAEKREDVFAKEAVHLEKGIEKQCNSLYEVKKRYLHSAEATRDNCLNGLKWVAETSHEEDLALVYIGSHGGNGSGTYKFYPANDSVSSDEMISRLSKVKGSLFLLVDTCHAGAMITDWKDCGKKVVILSACRDCESAYVWKFVNPFVDALEKADFNKDKVIDISEIETYVIDNIDKKQTAVESSAKLKVPVCRTERTYDDFGDSEGSDQSDRQADLSGGSRSWNRTTYPFEVYVQETWNQPRYRRQALYLPWFGSQEAYFDRRSSFGGM